MQDRKGIGGFTVPPAMLVTVIFLLRGYTHVIVGKRFLGTLAVFQANNVNVTPVNGRVRTLCRLIASIEFFLKYCVQCTSTVTRNIL